MHIITISRQFGSGGRELGKRLADRLGWDYYDREIIDSIARDHGLDPEFVKAAFANHGWHNVPLTYRSSFSHLLFDPAPDTELLIRERETLRGIAELGNNCIIIGRDADVVLDDYKPFRIYVCAEMGARLARCMKHEQKQPENERLSEKQILRNIRRIDRNRKMTREVLTGKSSADASAFDLTVSTTNWDIKRLSAAVADFALAFFEE
ncbi:MAG: cytidylate kinase-like family protein [Oscillospiraceae bacterium]|nr:cytidylate kinase-like family protein [Oscillospiraceae bacterium]